MSSEKVRAFHDEDAPQYDLRYESDPFFGRIYEPVTWGNIKRFLPGPGSRILDAGGGTGRWAIPLAGMGYRVTLTDIFRGMLQVAQEKVKSEVRD